MATRSKAVKPRVVHEVITDLTLRYDWHTVEYKAKYGDEEIALAASDALFYSEKFVALNRVIVRRLDNIPNEQLYKRLVNSGSSGRPHGMQSINHSSKSGRVVKHILGRLAEKPNTITLKGETIIRLKSFPTLSKYFCSMLRNE